MKKLKAYFTENSQNYGCYLVAAWLFVNGIILYLYKGSWTELTWVNQVNTVTYVALFLLSFGIFGLYGQKVMKKKRSWILPLLAFVFYGISLLIRGGAA